MRLLCLVKFVPDVYGFEFDFENNTLVRQNIRMILNPDDACALAFALSVKAGDPDCRIEVVSMAPRSVIPHMHDLLRLSVDRGILISDSLYAGSDTSATTEVLSKYISTCSFDCILTGSHSLDGDTAHVPVQLAESLDLDQMSGIVRIDRERFNRSRAIFDVEDEKSVSTYEITLPAVLSLSRESGYKMPYPKYEDLQRDVSDKLSIITNEVLGMTKESAGLSGSLTRVIRTYNKTLPKRNKTIVNNDENGIEYVFTFLKAQGFL